MSISEHPINSDADIIAIAAIAKAAGATTEYVASLKTALSNLQIANTDLENAKTQKPILLL